METRVDEIADRIYRLSTFVPDIGPTGITFNQFLIDADEPAIFHTGPRGMFPLVSEAVASVLPLERLRWIMFGHLEADECGAMNLFLAAAPNAQVAHTAMGCMVSINDLADRPPAPIALTAHTTLEAGASAASTPLTCLMVGTRTSSTKRPPAHSSVATSSPRWGRTGAHDQRCPGRRRADRGHVRRDVPHAADSTHDPPPRGARADDPRHHAWLVVLGRSQQGTPRAGRRVRPPVGQRQLSP